MHTPLQVADVFENGPVASKLHPRLNLDTEIRFHHAKDLHAYDASLLAAEPAAQLRPLAERLERDGFHWRLTRSLETAKDYLRERYRDDRDARFGLVASSKDRDLVQWGVPNDFPSTKRVKLGPWYGDAEDDFRSLSCRHLDVCVTEFGAQGLELDATLLAWGTDLVLEKGWWSNANARGYRKGAKLRDPRQLRINAYRVLLTRGRDACVVFVPPMAGLDETYGYLLASGFREI